MEFEKLRNVPVRHDRDLTIASLRTVKRVGQIQRARQNTFYTKRVANSALSLRSNIATLLQKKRLKKSDMEGQTEAQLLDAPEFEEQDMQVDDQKSVVTEKSKEVQGLSQDLKEMKMKEAKKEKKWKKTEKKQALVMDMT